MLEDIKVNGRYYKLTKEEVTKVEQFHKSRIAFAIIRDRVEFLCNDVRDIEMWLRDDFGIDTNNFEMIVRGYIRAGRIQFYTGSNYAAVKDFSNVCDQHLKVLVDKHFESFPYAGTIHVYNGLSIGRPGEIWSPLLFVKEIQV